MRKLFILCISLFAAMSSFAIEKCPNGGVEGAYDQCCKNNFVYNHSTKKYDYVQARLCGCPDGGKPGSSNTYDCCKDNYAYNEETGKYDYLNPEECGCPNGGKINRGVGVNGGNVCCKDGYAHEYYFGTDPVIYDEIAPEKCGCPNGMTPDKKNGAYCCKNGRVYLDKSEYGVQPDRCGCPDGGQVWKDRFCQQNGYVWNDKTKKYDIPNPDLGCPKGSEEKNGVCCKNGYAFNTQTSKFDSVNGFCGCQQGSQPSEWGKIYADMMKQKLSQIKIPDSEKVELKKYTERMVMQFDSFCCKNGKSYNNKTGNFDVDMPLCKPFPKNPNDITETLWKLCSYGILMCM